MLYCDFLKYFFTMFWSVYQILEYARKKHKNFIFWTHLGRQMYQIKIVTYVLCLCLEGANGSNMADFIHFCFGIGFNSQL